MVGLMLNPKGTLDMEYGALLGSVICSQESFVGHLSLLLSQSCLSRAPLRVHVSQADGRLL